jgi:polar amino acid transport system substrate-binding protein
VNGLILDDVKEGISVSKDKAGLETGVKAALQSMLDDGSYVKILTKYGLQDGAVTSLSQ